VNRAYQTLFHAIEMKRLMNRFASVDMRTVAPDARAKWLDMLHQHAAAFENQNAALRQEIQPIFSPATTFHGAEEPPAKAPAARCADTKLLSQTSIFVL